MASGAELKARLERFIAAQEAALAKADANYQAERARLRDQIVAVRAVLGKWDGKTDDLINALAAVGISVKTE